MLSKLLNADVWQQQAEKVLSWIVSKGGLIIIAFLFLLIGIKVTGWIVKLIGKSFERHNVEKSVSGFLLSLIRILLYVLIFISSASIIGFQVTSFVTILGTAGISVGLALQGSLSNLAGGILILVLKPFTVGDYILENGGGQEGTVISIDIFYTKLRTIDNKVVVIPNGKLSDSSLVNYSKENKRRLDISVGISYDADIRKTRNVLKQLIEADEYVLTSEPVDIIVDAFENSSVKMTIHVWVSTENYWPAKWQMLENIKYAFDKNDIEIPYQKIDIQLKDGGEMK